MDRRVWALVGETSYAVVQSGWVEEGICGVMTEICVMYTCNALLQESNITRSSEKRNDRLLAVKQQVGCRDASS